jgi:hypothetical protein
MGKIKKLLIVALFMTFLVSPIPWMYCMGGNAYGMPFPIVFPSHGDEPLPTIALEPDTKVHGAVLSPFSFLGNYIAMFVFGGVFFGFKAMVSKMVIKSRQSDR